MKRYVRASWDDAYSDIVREDSEEIEKALNNIFNKYGFNIKFFRGVGGFFVIAPPELEYPYPATLEFRFGTRKNNRYQLLISPSYLDGVDTTLPDDIVQELVQRAEREKQKAVAKRSWPRRSYWQHIDDDEAFENAWNKYLAKPENAVNDELQIFPEPSTQGGLGSMFIFDESGQRNWDNQPSIDFGEWCDAELSMASSSRSADEYAEKYRQYVLAIVGEQ